MQKRLRFLVLFVFAISVAAQAPEREFFFTALSKYGSSIAQLLPSQLSASNGLVISNVERLGAAPISFALVLDISRSRKVVFGTQNELAKTLLRDVVRDGQDQGIVVNFYDEPYLDGKLTNETDKLSAAIGQYEPRGGSAVFDAVYAAAHQLRDPTVKGNRPAVMFLISDGDDNASHISESRLHDYLRETGIRVYTFNLGGDRGSRGEGVLNRLSKESGGQAFVIRINKKTSVRDQCASIRKDLDNWFRATYSPSKSEKQARVESASKDMVVRAPTVSTR